ncbi:hypothetical protein AB4037_23485 [Labrys sp. KB_33_2]|uniref:hypothetical protein n=1 Tax=Labrys sp. KB_33_2 TaxID=3237479 RepID=UPI003F8FD155
MWFSEKDGIYAGDTCLPGDRLATDSEVAAWQAAHTRARLDAMSVSAFQAKAAMSKAQAAGITTFDLLAVVETIVNASTDPIVKLAWTTATEFNRQSPTIAALAAQVPLSSDQLDQLFELAATISA